MEAVLIEETTLTRFFYHAAMRFLLASVLALAIPLRAQQLTTPEAALGQPIGADNFLANYTQLSRWWRKLATESSRMTLESIGKTSYGQEMLMAVISSPQNLAKREEYRRIANRLCAGRMDEAEARRLAASGRSVVWIDAGMHATESVAAQNILELVWRMVSRNDAETLRILDDVILLVCPANPDGMEMVAKGYMATGKVGRLPVLYQRYVGHDNNRDFYMASQPETRAIDRILYRRWTPQIVYNHHQTAPRGTIIFTPPFRDPFNYNVDPLVVRGIDLVAAHMNNRFAREGKRGVISRTGAPYSTWWNGGLRTTVYFHNMIGILTEVFGKPTPTKIKQTINRRLPYGDYPMPIASQPWHARQTIEYLQTANYAILDLASRYRNELLLNFWRMGHNSVRRGSEDHWTVTPKLIAIAKQRDDESAFEDPALRDARAYVIPRNQPDFAAATRFVNALIRCGVEVHRASRKFTLGGASYAAGCFLVRCDQAFRAHVRDMFEPQWHPDDVGSGGTPVRPYDSAGWTLAMQMGVQFDRFYDDVQGPFEPLDTTVRVLPGKATDGRAGWLIRAGSSNAFFAVYRLLGIDRPVQRLQKALDLGKARFAPGTFFLPRGKNTPTTVHELADNLGIDCVGIDKKPTVPLQSLKAPRVGLFDVWGGDIATGWTEWALREIGIQPKRVFGDRVLRGELHRDFDVLIFQTGLPSFAKKRGGRKPKPITDAFLAKLQAALPPFEDWSHIGARRTTLTRKNCKTALRAFVRDGGKLLAVGKQCDSLIHLFELPVQSGIQVEGKDGKLRPANHSEFFIPGSLVRVRVRGDSHLGWGMPSETVTMFRRSPVFRVVDQDEAADPPIRVDTVLSYAANDALASGWAIGAKHLADRPAALDIHVGAGRIFLFGSDVLYRGQPWTTFKLVFNALLDPNR